MFKVKRSEDCAREPFLKSSQQEDWQEEFEPPAESKGFFRRVDYAAVATHVVIALVYLLLITSTTWFKRSRVVPESRIDSATDIYCKIDDSQWIERSWYLKAPAEEAIEYELVDFPLRDFYHDNPYVGDPRPEHDEAWRKLLQSELAAIF